jgi:hypothetical protein
MTGLLIVKIIKPTERVCGTYSSKNELSKTMFKSDLFKENGPVLIKAKQVRHKSAFPISGLRHVN